jgi:predicted dienelactone hydrolase
MKTTALLAATLFCLSLPAQAGETGRPVGAITLELDNKSSARKFPVELWYEAVAGTRAEGMSIRPPLRPIMIARGAQPNVAVGKRPLIVISHGNWGTRYSQGWLALRLVNAGHVVLSTSHPGTVGDDQTVAGRYRLWDRSTDVSFALDRLLADPNWAGLIDGRRIGFVGHSFGGWTGVSLAGGRYDPMRQRDFCSRLAHKDFYCDSTLKDEVSGLPVGDAGNSFRDPRFKAYYIMASGPGQGFSKASLKAITAPFIVDTAELDEVLDPRANSSPFAAQIPGARETMRRVGHFAYVPECRPVVGGLLARVAGVPICDDPRGIDRAAAHEQIARDVIRFFSATLRGGD